MSDRCSGNCCREFTLLCGKTPEEIDTFLRTKAWDGVQIADMVIPLRPLVAGTVLPNGDTVPEGFIGSGWIFTCKHFDPATNNCGIYETRPRMCRSFPYGSRCEHGDRCTWDAGRAGHWPPRFHRWDSGEKRTHLNVYQPSGASSQREALAVSDTLVERTAAA